MKRYELHTHTLLSDGTLVPSELVRRAQEKGVSCVAITDHADASSLYSICVSTIEVSNELNNYFDDNGIKMRVLAGVEITHVPPELIGRHVNVARKFGIEVVLIHGESVVEPVRKKTNFFSVQNPEVDILAHPGFITEEEVELSKENRVFLEITSRNGHNITNGFIARMALEIGAGMVVNSDAHTPQDIIDAEFAKKVLLGASVPEKMLKEILEKNPKKFVR